MKIPPKTVFWCQIIASIWACFVQVATMNWTLGAIENVCTPYVPHHPSSNPILTSPVDNPLTSPAPTARHSSHQASSGVRPHSLVPHQTSKTNKSRCHRPTTHVRQRQHLPRHTVLLDPRRLFTSTLLRPRALLPALAAENAERACDVGGDGMAASVCSSSLRQLLFLISPLSTLPLAAPSHDSNIN